VMSLIERVTRSSQLSLPVRERFRMSSKQMGEAGQAIQPLGSNETGDPLGA
jgi:hypothetical protein